MARARTLVLNTKVNVTGADKLQGLGKTLQRVGTGLSVGITAPLALLGATAARAASDLNESMNAINVTFGETSDAINKIGETSAESFGLSQRAFNDVAVRFSAFADTVAGEGGDVSKVIEDITRRGTDFASVYNLEVNDALGLFQSGLAGETEPLRKFGIDLSAAAVEAHAMSTGINDGTHALTESEKVQARYSLLMEATSKVQGDFANTSGEVANQQRIAAAAAEDAAAALGQKFLPIQQKIVGVLSDALDAWSDLPGPVQDATVAFGAAAAALGPLLVVFGTLVRTIGTLIKAGPALKLFFTTSFLGPIGLAVAATLALREGIEAITGQTFEEPFFANLLNQTEQGKKALKDLKEIAADTGQNWSEVGQQVKDTMDEMGVSWDQAIRIVRGGERDISEALVKSGQDWDAYQEQVSGAMDESTATVQSASEVMADIAGSLPKLMADELLAAQFHLTDATTELVTFMEEALTPAQEIFQLQGFLDSSALADGLADGNPLVRKKAQEMQQAAIDRIAELRGGFFNQGYESGRSYAMGMDASSRDPALLNWISGSAARLAAAARGIFPSSEPKDPNSPLRGITKAWGFWDVFAKGLSDTAGGVPAAINRVLSTPSMALSPVPIGGGAGGAGVTQIINLNVQGDLKARDADEAAAAIMRAQQFATVGVREW